MIMMIMLMMTQMMMKLQISIQNNSYYIFFKSNVLEINMATIACHDKVNS